MVRDYKATSAKEKKCMKQNLGGGEVNGIIMGPNRNIMIALEMYLALKSVNQLYK